jgi:hypothetical protein
LASLLWFIADYLARDYSSLVFPIWDALVRLFIFSAIGLLLFYPTEVIDCGIDIPETEQQNQFRSAVEVLF